MRIPLLLLTTLRIILGTVLLFSGISKLSSFNDFVINVSSYQVLSGVLEKPVSYLLVSAEITLGIALCIGYFSRGAAILSSGLFLIFAIAITHVLWQNTLVTDCGCANYLFSILDSLGFSLSTSPNWKIVFTNVILSGASIRLTSSRQRGYGLETLILPNATS